MSTFMGKKNSINNLYEDSNNINSNTVGVNLYNKLNTIDSEITTLQSEVGILQSGNTLYVSLAEYTLTTGDFGKSVSCDTSGLDETDMSIVLPNPAGFETQSISITNLIHGPHNVIITPPSGTIGGRTSIVLAPGDSVKIVAVLYNGYQIQYSYTQDFVTSNIPQSSGFTVSNNTPTNVTSISLLPGDWDIMGNVSFLATGICTELACWSLDSSATVPDPSNITDLSLPAINFSGMPIPYARFNLSTTTTIYLSCLAVFSTGSVTVYGTIFARRVS